jgi:hypothetical protein
MELDTILGYFRVALELAINKWPSAIAITLFTYAVYWLYYGLFISPTRKIPGPLLNRFSFMPMGAAGTRWRLSREIFELHEQYGKSNFRPTKYRSNRASRP